MLAEGYLCCIIKVFEWEFEWEWIRHKFIPSAKTKLQHVGYLHYLTLYLLRMLLVQNK